MFSYSPRKLLRYCFLTVLALAFILSNTSSSVFKVLRSTTPSVSQDIQVASHTGTKGTEYILPPTAHCDLHTCITPVSTISTSTNDMPYIAHFIDTWNNIHAFLTFDYNISNPGAVAQRYELVWGAQMDHVGALRSSNPNIFLSYYIPFHRDAEANHNLAYWKSTHPDWILYKCDRVTPAYEFGEPKMPLDFSNPALVSWQVQNYGLPASSMGYNGIAADNVDLTNLFGACGVYIQGKWVQRYTGNVDDPQWVADVITWLTHMQLALHRLPHPLALITNFSSGDLSFTSTQVQQVVSHADGVLDEDGFTAYGNGYVTDSDWINRIQFIENVQQQGKPYYITNLLPSVSSAGIQWALASYLMCKQHSAALYIAAAQEYGSDVWHNEYNAQIGHPIDSMYKAQNVYWRDYSQGLSIVNPGATTTYTITLNANHHYIDLYGNAVGPTLTMSPHSGIVLLVAS